MEKEQKVLDKKFDQLEDATEDKWEDIKDAFSEASDKFEKKLKSIGS